MANSLLNIDLNGRYTYADYLKWSLEEYVELIKGKVFRMSPAPLSQHQILVHRLDVELGYYLKKRLAKYFQPLLMYGSLLMDYSAMNKLQPSYSLIYVLFATLQK